MVKTASELYPRGVALAATAEAEAMAETASELDARGAAMTEQAPAKSEALPNHTKAQETALATSEALPSHSKERALAETAAARATPEALMELAKAITVNILNRRLAGRLSTEVVLLSAWLSVRLCVFSFHSTPFHSSLRQLRNLLFHFTPSSRLGAPS